ncbi:uncharacterized protein LOC132560118 [Ylistrum balloti]|uniref:uncharacterized protein LOC132560118 n=1 Tax=Ylistrum balloti TaxID=509963 RepID=UPI002905BA70|nr:uncharacterized protein LOC132560118 [Ylistrum balloti]
MSMSGISLAPEVKAAFLEMKQNKSYGYIIIKLDKKQKVMELFRTGPKNAGAKSRDDAEGNFLEMISVLQSEEEKDEEKNVWSNPCFVVYDFPLMTQTTQNINRLVLISKIFDSSPLRLKMIYAATMESVRSQLDIQHKVNVNDASDMSFDFIEQELKSKKV